MAAAQDAAEGKGAAKPLAAVSRALEAFKYLLSTLLSAAAIAFVGFGIAQGHAVLQGPPALHYAVLVFVLVLLAYLEGLQVAILALEAQDLSAWRVSHPRAHKLHSLATHGKNVQRFLVGRQFYVVFVVFLCSQVTTFPGILRPEWFPEVLWVALVETALPGALIVLAFGQLMPQLIASRHPVVFCNLPGAMLVLRITLILEAFGITHFSWLLTGIVSRISGLHSSEDWSGKNASPEPSTTATTSTGPSEVSSIEVVVDDSTPSIARESVLQRLTSIQGQWRVTGQKIENFELLNTPLVLGDAAAELPDDKLFITSAIAEAGLQASGLAGARVQEAHGDTPQAHIYPTPREIVEHLVKTGQEVPRFLLPPGHDLHVPPHIVAYSLMSGITSAGAN